MRIAYFRLLAAQERGPQLDRARSKYEGGRCGTAVSDATCGDDWNRHSVDHLRQE